jgi:hypothetical protein
VSRRETYKIEKYDEIRQRWVTMLSWWGLQKSYAEGAFMVLKAGYGGSQQYRLCTDSGAVVDTWNTGEVRQA